MHAQNKSPFLELCSWQLQRTPCLRDVLEQPDPKGRVWSVQTEHLVTEVTDLTASDVFYCVKSTDFLRSGFSITVTTISWIPGKRLHFTLFLHPTIFPILASVHKGIQASQ